MAGAWIQMTETWIQTCVFALMLLHRSQLILIIVLFTFIAVSGNPLAKTETQEKLWGPAWVGNIMDWNVRDQFDRVITGHEWDFHSGGIDFGPAGDWNDHGRIERHGDKTCVVSYSILFDVADKLAYDLDEEVTLEVLFDTRVTDGYIFSADSVATPYTFSKKLEVNNDRRWQWETIKIDRARFSNRREGGADFQIASYAANLYHNHGKPTVSVCDVKITRSHKTERPSNYGVFSLTIKDENGKPTAARVGLYDKTGKSPLPSDDATLINMIGDDARQVNMVIHQEYDFWPGKGRIIFYADGAYRSKLPTGEYQLVLTKGPEYRIINQNITVRANIKNEVQITMNRWRDMPAEGWYSADHHIHNPRVNLEADKRIMQFVRAEDVHLASNLQSASPDNPHYYENRNYGKKGHYQEGNYFLISGQESPDTAELGHTIGLNTKKFHLAEEYNDYTEVAKEVQSDGGLFGYSHLPIYPMLNPQRGIAIFVPTSDIQFFEILQFGTFGGGLRLYYDFLNMGFKLLPLGATDFPFAALTGTERTYSQVSGNFKPQAWFDAYAKGHTFITTGPMLDLSVNGAPMGSELRLKVGDELFIEAEATINPDLDGLDRIELVIHGEVVTVVKASPDATAVTLSHKLTLEDSLWLAIRAYGRGKGEGGVDLSQQGGFSLRTSEAHTAPVYVYVGNSQTFADKRKIQELIPFWQSEALAVGFQPVDYSLNEGRYDYTEADLKQEWNDELPTLSKIIEQAIIKYDDILQKTLADKP